MLRAIGRKLEEMEGRFLAGRDVGLPVEDGALVRAETRYMVDESDVGVGDLNRRTAEGVLAGARAALRFRYGRDGLEGVRVAIQERVGWARGSPCCSRTRARPLTVSDTNPRAIAALRERVDLVEAAPEAIYDVECELFAPCAVGGVLDESTALRLACGVVAGSANNILSHAAIGDTLASRGIVFAPDFLVSSGALIQGVRFLLHGERDSRDAIAAIEARTEALLTRAAGRSPERVLTDELAHEFDLKPTAIL